MSVYRDTSSSFSVEEKNSIVQLCFSVYTKKQEDANLTCSEFYALCYAATPPELWLHISWIGRCLHSFLRSSTNSQTPVALDIPKTGKRRAVSSKGKNLATIPGYAFISIDLSNPSKEVLELQGICKKYNIQFVDSLTHPNVIKAKDAIDLFYRAQKLNVVNSVDFLEILRSGLGYTSTLSVDKIKENCDTHCVAEWKNKELIRVPKTGTCPPFVVFHIPEDNSIRIEISTFRLRYNLELSDEILKIDFVGNHNPEKNYQIISHHPIWDNS